ncbi:hypothetical protein [Brevundimonas sp. SL130]|uniref:hypothetical protein n=1 Tax=Brevundimonas sp. SL130 TaxID=2995143 RepID=UPI00226CD7EC|nr:hypothetical protein [Brevundimonas sp. SL130]WAC59589.1 hypothetical protein OU998_15435 [Brevundimonas sp. SL130]
MTFQQNPVVQRRQVVVPDDLAQRSHYEGMTFPLFSLYRQTVEATNRSLIEDKTFTSCVIEGPGVLLALSGVHFDGCNMGENGGDVRSLVLRPVSPQKVVGTIAMQNCKFDRCVFFGMGFTGTDEFIDHFIKALGGAPTA